MGSWVREEAMIALTSLIRQIIEADDQSLITNLGLN